jgi:predicted esterase
VPRPDIIVAISGCHYEGGQLDLVDTEAWGNKGADIVLLAGDKDTNCPPWETEDAAAEMRSAGYEVDLSMLDGADHFRPGLSRPFKTASSLWSRTIPRGSGPAR